MLRLFDLTAACTGASEKTLRNAGIPFEVVHLHPGSHAGYYPGAEPIALKLLFSPDTGRLLGAQAVGRDGVDKRIDVLATATKGGDDGGRSGGAGAGLCPAVRLGEGPGEPGWHGRRERRGRTGEGGAVA